MQRNVNAPPSGSLSASDLPQAIGIKANVTECHTPLTDCDVVTVETNVERILLHQKRHPWRCQRSQNERVLYQQASSDRLVLAFAVSVSALSTSQSFAFSSEAQQMCTGDAFKLCSSEIPTFRDHRCMIKHAAS